MSSDLLNFLATIGVGIIGLASVIIQTKSKEKTENIDRVVKDIKLEFSEKINETNTKIEQLRKESEENDKKLNARLDNAKVQMLQLWLTHELTKIKNQLYKPSEEQTRAIKLAKEAYNQSGGDSFVDDLYDEVHENGLL